MKQKQALFSFNRGLVSEFALAREDISRVSLGASIFVNWIARVMGSMAFRQGWQYLGQVYGNSPTRTIPFVFSSTDTAIIELTNTNMNVWVNDVKINRASVSTSIANGNPFVIGSWNHTGDQAPGVTSVSGGKLNMLSNGAANCVAYQTVTVAAQDRGIMHGIRIVVSKGVINLKIGSTVGGDDYFTNAVLGTGTHSIGIVPTGNFTIEFVSALSYNVQVSQCYIETSGYMGLPTPWLTADLGSVRYEQSADVIYIGCQNYAPMKIERYGTYSWSIVNYQSQDGPFRVENVGPITLTPSAISGDITITASQPLFYSGHVGALFSITSIGQTVATSFGGTGSSSSIVVTGVGVTRAFNIALTFGAGAGTTVVLNYSFDNVNWYPVTGKSWTANVSTSYTDGLDNQIVYYNLECTVYGTDTVSAASLSISTGSIRGIALITGFTDNTHVSAEVLKPLGNITASTTWEEGYWSTFRGFPTSCRLHDGRLWWFGNGSVYGSVSDGYESFDETNIGDSGPIISSIGFGPIDTINWGLSGFELTLGGQVSEISVRSSALQDPIRHLERMIARHKYFSQYSMVLAFPVRWTACRTFE